MPNETQVLLTNTNVIHKCTCSLRDIGTQEGLELVIVRVRTSVWANKERCTKSMA
jgi:hypothetical protein